MMRKYLMVNLTLIGLSLILGGLTILISSDSLLSAEPWKTMATHVGSVMIGAGIVELVTHWILMNEVVREVTGSVLRAIKFPISAFYVSRASLEPLKEELQGAEEIWALWGSGPYRDLESFFPKGRRGRILLMKPCPSYGVLLGKIGERKSESIQHVINEVTQFAASRRGNGIEVRWFDGMIGNSFFIVTHQGMTLGLEWTYLSRRESLPSALAFEWIKQRVRSFSTT